MKVVIIAGGYGTRLTEYTHTIPKPMVEIGDEPILTHIMKIIGLEKIKMKNNFSLLKIQFKNEIQKIFSAMF